mmetsp:Transcript_17373/g.69805  ORF Transcript_17373/g.69805 Transcript_17373/m.69805 type:complete len:265 (-) Transcript_17373:233-1027(-)
MLGRASWFARLASRRARLPTGGHSPTTPKTPLQHGSSRRTFIAVPQGDALPVVGGLVAANVAVWGLWQTQPPAMMARHFTLSADDVLRKPYTLATSVFSHRDGWHLLGNMVTLFFFGPEVIYAIGARQFLLLYSGAGLASGTCQLAASVANHAHAPHPYWRRHSERYLGASGAVNACVAWSVLASPWRLIVVFAELLPIPLPAILYGAAFVGKDLAALLGIHIPYVSDRVGPGIAHGAHVAGAACGAAHFFLFRRRPPPGRYTY